MPLFRRRRKPGPVTRARIAWKLAGILLALVARDWAGAVAYALDVLRLLGVMASAAGQASAVAPMYAAAGAAKLFYLREEEPS